jgi:hypothetical protein
MKSIPNNMILFLINVIAVKVGFWIYSFVSNNTTIHQADMKKQFNSGAQKTLLY